MNDLKEFDSPSLDLFHTLAWIHAKNDGSISKDEALKKVQDETQVRIKPDIETEYFDQPCNRGSLLDGALPPKRYLASSLRCKCRKTAV